MSGHREAGPVALARAHAPMLAALAFFLLVAVNVAWFSDDAFISARTSWNLANGHGLTWNIAERVQSFTNPLWVLVGGLAVALTGEVFLTLHVLGLAVAVATAALAFGVSGTALRGAIAVVMLAAANAHIEHAVSGLENGLSHLLLVAVIGLAARTLGAPGAPGVDRPALLSFLFALVLLNRLDHALLIAPLCLALLVQRPRRFVPMLLGGWPLYLWLGFALVYFGNPFPNTAFSKLYHGEVAPEFAVNGWDYLLRSAHADPMLFVAPVLLAVAFRRGGLAERTIGAGVVVMVGYVVSIGGDFMANRFLSAPMTVTIVLFARTVPVQARLGQAVAVMAVAIGLLQPRSALLPWWMVAELPADASHSTLDARPLHYKWTGLLPNLFGDAIEDMPDVRSGRAAGLNGPSVVMRGAIGFFGAYAGDQVYVTDRFALVDPPRARLLPERMPYFRVGHASRRLPYGYLASLVCGDDRVEDAEQAALLRDHRLIMRAPLLAPDRLDAIMRLLARGMGPLGKLDPGASEDPSPVRNAVNLSSERLRAGAAAVAFGTRGVLVHRCGAPLTALAFASDGATGFELDLQDLHGRTLATLPVPASQGEVRVPLPADPAPARVWLRPVAVEGVSEVDFRFHVDRLAVE